MLDGNMLVYNGYKFIGWNTQVDGQGTNYSAADTLTITSDVTLYAVWEKVADQSIQ